MESKIQRRLIDILEANDWHVVKLIKTTKNGIPDLFAEKKSSRSIYIEVKDKTGVIDDLQLYRMTKILQKTDSLPIIYWPECKDDTVIFNGYTIHIISNLDEFRTFINNTICANKVARNK